MMRIGVWTSPIRVAVFNNCTRSTAVTVALIRPLLTTVPAAMVPWTRPSSPMMTWPFVWMSPSRRPSIRTVPSTRISPLSCTPLANRVILSSPPNPFFFMADSSPVEYHRELTLFSAAAPSRLLKKRRIIPQPCAPAERLRSPRAVRTQKAHPAATPLLSGEPERLPQPLPYAAPVNLAVDVRLRPLDEHLLHLLGTLRSRQLSRLGIDGTDNDAGGLGKRRRLLGYDPLGDVHPDGQCRLRARQTYRPFIVESHPHADRQIRRVPDEPGIAIAIGGTGLARDRPAQPQHLRLGCGSSLNHSLQQRRHEIGRLRGYGLTAIGRGIPQGSPVTTGSRAQAGGAHPDAPVRDRSIGRCHVQE